MKKTIGVPTGTTGKLDSAPKLQKATLRVPTAEPYAYIELHVEDTPEGILEAYNLITGLVKAQENGLPQKEWNELLDNYILGKGMPEHMVEKMGKAQAWLIHEFDKATARIASKEQKLHKID